MMKVSVATYEALKELKVVFNNFVDNLILDIESEDDGEEEETDDLGDTPVVRVDWLQKCMDRHLENLRP